MRMESRDEDKNDGDSSDNFSKLVDSLSSATENCKLIAQFILNARDVEACGCDGGVISPALSIHSLNDTLAINGADDRYESRNHSRYDDGFDNKTGSTTKSDLNTSSLDKSDESDSDGSEAQSERVYKNVPQTNTSYLGSLFDTVKLLVLLLLNVVTLFIMAELMFVSLVYVLTGDRYIEFYVDRAPDTWLDKAKLVAFGPEQEAVRIQSIVELFYRDNIVNILKYFIDILTRSVS